MGTASPPPSPQDRIAAELRSLASQVEAFQIAPDPRYVPRYDRGCDPPKSRDIPAVLRAYIRARRARESVMPADIFADPAWDILLDLLLADLERRRVSISSACIASAVPPTTALRWIGALESKGAIMRVADPDDRRRSHLQLTPVTRATLMNWVERHLATPPAGGSHILGTPEFRYDERRG